MMFGVPGRSMGCVTCRRRKKGCDLRRPVCGQCKRKGLVCGGYDRDRVFVNEYTPESTTTAAAASSLVVWHTAGLSTRTAPRAQNEPALRAISASYATATLSLPQSLFASAYAEGTFGSFWDIFCPNSVQVRLSHFAENLHTLYTQDDALRTAVLALSASITGRAHNDQALVEQGRKLYGRGLQEMAKAIRDSNRVRSDALLAVPRVMAMFEIHFGADAEESKQGKSWSSHATGELAMFIWRGPKALAEGASHQLFVDGRINPIIASIWMRKASVLNEDQWRTTPWITTPKTPKDTIIDLLAEMPNLLEELDRMEVLRYSCPDYGTLVHLQLVGKCRELDTKLELWSRVNNIQLCHPSTEDAVPIAFADFSSAYLSVMYWTTCIFVYETLQILLGTAASLPLALLTDPSKLPRLYARRVARSIAYMFRPEWGIQGPTNMAFPAGVALYFFHNNEQKEDEAYKTMMFKSWTDASLPDTIKQFLISMRQSAAPGHKWKA